MKIAYIVGNFPVLSETFVLNEVIRLKNLGHDITVFAFRGPNNDELKKFTDEGRQLASETIYLTKKEALFSVLTNPFSIFKLWKDNVFFQKNANGKPSFIMRIARAVALAKKFKSGGFTHLHAHWPYASQIAHLIILLTDRSYSISVHAHEVAHESGHFPLVMKTTRFSSFCNAGALNYLIKELTYDFSDKAHLIYHGVDINKFPFLPLHQITDSINVISAGRLTQTKGFDRLIRGCALACSRGAQVKLTILGQGALEPELRKLASDLDFTNHLNMPGWVSQDEVTEYMKASHVFALMADTGFHDGLPNVALEAMACGRPVILSPLPAVNEAIDDSVHGFILNSQNDIEGLAQSLEKFLHEKNLAADMGKKARERVIRDHDADTQIDRMVELFKAM